MTDQPSPKTTRKAAGENEAEASKPEAQKENGANGSSGPAASGQDDAVVLLKADHRAVEKNFARYSAARQRAEKENIVEEICNQLIVHTMLEEEIFYAACRNKIDEKELDEAQVEHDCAKLIIEELRDGTPGDPCYDAKVTVLCEQIQHHVADEEEPQKGIFALATKAGIDLRALGRKISDRKAELVRLAEADRLPRPIPRSFRAQGRPAPKSRSSMEEPMGQYYQQDYSSGRSRAANERPRDEYGRFMSDDEDYDNRRSSGGGGGGRGRYVDDDDDRGSRGRSRAASNRDRDEQGRFMSEDDDRGGRGGSRGGGGDSGGGRGRYTDDDDDRRGGGGRRTGGWFGDSEGHSRASREGWRNSDHEGSGWYGDPEGHSRASREGWRNSDHRGSGWYGDPEGHSEASRRGWDDRDDDCGSRRGSGRYDEDDDRGGRGGSSRGGGGGGPGGWFGDPRGHSEASRRGWEDRDRR